MDDFEQLGIGTQSQVKQVENGALDLAASHPRFANEARRNALRFAWDEKEDSSPILTLVAYTVSFAFGAGLLFWWGWWVLAKMGVVG